MKTLKIFFGVVVAVGLLGSSVAMAEIRLESMQRLMFSVSTDDGSITLPDFSFCDIDSFGGEEAQATCMMTPGGPAPNVLMDLPDIPRTVPASGYTSAQAAIAPVSLLQSPSPPGEPRGGRGSEGGGGNGGGNGDDGVIVVPQDPPPYAIPEPATLVIVGLGIAGVVAARRWKKV